MKRSQTGSRVKDPSGPLRRPAPDSPVGSDHQHPRVVAANHAGARRWGEPVAPCSNPPTRLVTRDIASPASGSSGFQGALRQDETALRLSLVCVLSCSTIPGGCPEGSPITSLVSLCRVILGAARSVASACAATNHHGCSTMRPIARDARTGHVFSGRSTVREQVDSGDVGGGQCNDGTMPYTTAARTSVKAINPSNACAVMMLDARSHVPL